MRLLVLTPDYPPAWGGIQKVAHEIAVGMRGMRTTVVTRAHPLAAEFDATQSHRIVRAGSPRLPRASIPLLNARALAVGVAERPDVVLATHVLAGPAAAAVARLRRVPWVLYVHADEITWRPPLTRFGTRSAAITVAPSAYGRELAIEMGAPPERVRVIHPGVDPVATPSRAAPREPIILTVSRLVERYKGHDVLARALPLVRERVPEASWVIVGDGPLRSELEGLVAAAGAGDAVRFTGAVSDAERDDWFARASVFCMPSRLPEQRRGGEGFGIVYVEAAAHGLPVVAGNVAGALDAVEDGVNGLLVDPTDPVALAGALSELLTDRDRAAAMGAAGVRHAQRLQWPAVAERVERLLRELAAR